MYDRGDLADLQARLEEFGLAPRPEEQTFLPDRIIARSDRSPLIAALTAALAAVALLSIAVACWHTPQAVFGKDIPLIPIQLASVFAIVMGVGVPVGRDFFWRGGLAYEISCPPDENGGTFPERRLRLYRPPYRLYRFSGIVFGGALAATIWLLTA